MGLKCKERDSSPTRTDVSQAKLTLIFCLEGEETAIDSFPKKGRSSAGKGLRNSSATSQEDMHGAKTMHFARTHTFFSKITVLHSRECKNAPKWFQAVSCHASLAPHADVAYVNKQASEAKKTGRWPYHNPGTRNYEP